MQRWAVQGQPHFTKVLKVFWAVFGYGVRSDLVAIEGDPESARGGVTARCYLSVLQEHLPTVMDANSIFMHDNARIHMARIVKSWLEEQTFEVMQWPAYSLDLNPIKNLWFFLKERIYKRCPELLTMRRGKEIILERLIQEAKLAWDEIGDNLMERLSDTMPNRVRAVIEAEGWYNKY